MAKKNERMWFSPMKALGTWAVTRHWLKDTGECHEQGRNTPMTLGELIDALEKLPPKGHVCFDFCGLEPTHIGSYRGYYDQLALGFKGEPGHIEIGALVAELRGAIGSAFMGYKGGSYIMDRATPMWAANYSECNATAIVGVEVDDYSCEANGPDCIYARLVTAHVSF